MANQELNSIDFNEMCRLSGVDRKALVIDLNGHKLQRDPLIDFPDQFFVVITDGPLNDTESLKCYEAIDDVREGRSFWEMGRVHIGYWTTLAMFRLGGKLLNK